ncbi:twin-arginine translocase TatA/TatE family subunit [Candidatus Saccharibacteria bacterium]|nr:MAG: twin-arginine translocase TatA/TatE family subunit [Candidatus Saccharibacteria bacterium]
METSVYFADILGLGTPELIIIVVIILLLFGGSQLPKLARNLGSSAKELRKGLDDAKGGKSNKTASGDTAQNNNTDTNRG